jgi:hypothetical protein
LLTIATYERRRQSDRQQKPLFRVVLIPNPIRFSRQKRHHGGILSSESFEVLSHGLLRKRFAISLTVHFHCFINQGREGRIGDLPHVFLQKPLQPNQDGVVTIPSMPFAGVRLPAALEDCGQVVLVGVELAGGCLISEFRIKLYRLNDAFDGGDFSSPAGAGS